MNNLPSTLALAARVAGKGGKIWLVGDSRMPPGQVLVEREGVMFAFETELAHGVACLAADAVNAVRGPLEGMEAVQSVRVVESFGAQRLIILSAEAEAAIAMLPPGGVPQGPQLHSVTWQALPADGSEHLVRAAGLACAANEDRPGLTWVKVGPLVEATDEVCCFRAPLGLNFSGRVPASALLALPAKVWRGADRVCVGDMGDGGLAVRLDGTPSLTIVTPGRLSKDLWAFNLDRIFTAAEKPPVLATVSAPAKALAKAVRDAIPSLEHAVVALEAEAGGLKVHGGSSVQRLKGAGTGMAEIRVDAKILLGALKGAKDLESLGHGLAFRGPRQPLQIAESTGARVLVYPVLEG